MTDPDQVDEPKEAQPTELKLTNRRAAAFSGGLVGAVFGIVGVIFLEPPLDQSLGFTLFFLLPIVSGFAAAISSPKSQFSWVITFATTAGFALFSAVALGMGGWICVLMAAVIMFPALIVGLAIGSVFRKRKREPPDRMLLLLVLAVAASDAVERRYLPATPRVETVRSAIEMDVAPDVAFASILSFSELGGEESVLFALGLPRPVRCSLTGSGVGARRTCYFDSGIIEQTITSWEPGKELGLRVTRSTLPLGSWLQFRVASYDLETVGGRTLVSRSTEYASSLRPGWYWRWPERLAIRTEQDFVLRNARRQAELVAATGASR